MEKQFRIDKKFTLHINGFKVLEYLWAAHVFILISLLNVVFVISAQKMKFSIMDFFNECDIIKNIIKICYIIKNNETKKYLWYLSSCLWFCMLLTFSKSISILFYSIICSALCKTLRRMDKIY